MFIRCTHLLSWTTITLAHRKPWPGWVSSRFVCNFCMLPRFILLFMSPCINLFTQIPSSVILDLWLWLWSRPRGILYPAILDYQISQYPRSIWLIGQGSTWRTIPGSQCQRYMSQLKFGLSMPINPVSWVHWQEKRGGQGMVWCQGVKATVICSKETVFCKYYTNGCPWCVVRRTNKTD